MVLDEDGELMLGGPLTSDSADQTNRENILAKIAAERKKLLDTGLRNPLVNYPIEQRRSSFIRVIDELPDQLWEKLISSSSGMQIVGLPVIDSNNPPDEQTHEFLVALAEAKRSDEIYVQAMSLPVPIDQVETAKPDESIELGLRDRVRSKLGMSPVDRTRPPTLRELAAQIGVTPGYDLPRPSEGPAKKRHSDAKIQTYLREDVLEKLLKKLSGDIRLRREEAGLETGYAMFAFLEWYDPGSPERPRYAPLLMLPIEVEQREWYGAKRFFVRSRDGDEPAVNKSLTERLKGDLGLHLPEFISSDEDEDAGDTPESYFEKVELLLEKNRDRVPKWKLRRFVTIGSVQFGRLVMYDDLDPTAWPSTLSEHPLLAPLLLEKGNGADGFAEDYENADEPQPDRPEALLLRDADSSQHSAILDALKGRSFALEGPPGTGKSQTIANLIGAALAQRKTVLFLAEKMAALDVVYQRLRQVGLGEFCLQLHSTKARKRELFESIKARLDMSEPVRDGTADRVRRELKDRRARLNDYTAVIGAPIGGAGATVHQVLWWEISAREQLEQVLGVGRLPGDLIIEGAETLSEQGIDRATQTAQSMARCFSEALEESNPRLGHPCRGLMITVSAPFAANDLQEAMGEVTKALKLLLNAADPLIDVESQTLCKLQDVTESVGELPERIDNVEASMLAALRQDDAQAATAFFKDLEAFQKRKEPDPIADDEDAIFADPTLIDDVVRVALAHLPDNATLATLQETLEQLGCERDRREAEFDTLQKLGRLLGFDGLRRRVDALSVLQAAELALSLDGPINDAAPQLAQEARAALVELLRVANELAAMRQDLSRVADLDEAALVSERLVKAAHYVTSSWAGRLLSGDAREANAVFKRCILAADNTSRPDAAVILNRAHCLLEAEREFLDRPVLLAILGGRPHSILDALGALEHRAVVEEFRAQVDSAFGGRSPLSDTLSQRLKAFSDWDRLQLSACVDSDCIAWLRESFTRYGPADWLAAFDVWLQDQQTTIDRLDRVLRRAERVGLRRDADLGSLSHIFGERCSYLEHRKRLDATILHPDLSALVSGSRSRIDRLGRLIELYRELCRIPLTDSARRAIEDADYVATRASLLALLPLLVDVKANLANLEKVAMIDPVAFLGTASLYDAQLRIVSERCARAVSRPEAISTWAKYSAARREALEQGLTQLTRFLEKVGEQGKLTEAVASKVFEYAYANRLARLAYDQHPTLANFRSQDHSKAREQFRVLDKALLEANRDEIVHRLFDLGRSAPQGQAGRRRRDDTDVLMLRREAGKRQAHVPIRTAFRQAGTAINALTPCILMSPMTVAQFLPKQVGTIDVLLIDEASQMRAEDALGAILRAKQVIVVGDPKQMPPSDLFKETTQDDEDEIEGIQAESVLDLTIGAFRPARRLRWHYRSKHQSLISFSNSKFYDGSLLVAPSAIADQAELGVCHHFVGDAVYKARLNPREAETLIGLFQRHVHERPNETAGLVAINRPQADFLQELLDVLCSEDDEVAAYCANWAEQLEPVFVKNLENVQGDERDAIFLSTVYGPNEAGSVYNRFNSVGGEVGWRRFNVLVTRAKRRLHLVTSLKSGDVKVEETTHRGIRALRDYLEFAKDGTLPPEARLTRRSPDSQFEEFVLEALRSSGYVADPQIGASGFFIDIGIRDPDRPGRYLLGIECDGAAYHSTKSARDRDRLRQEILEANGWTIYRIWSTDWFDNPKRELSRLHSSIERCRRQT